MSILTISSARSPSGCVTSSSYERGWARRSGTQGFDDPRLDALFLTLPVSWCRVAVELDGAQHRGDPIAYRRDRRKDQLLQENGYLVLRLLAEDVGRDLDVVLDAVLRSLSNRRASSPTAHTLTISRRSPK